MTGEPNTFSVDERWRFLELVEIGGEVDLVALQNLENARALVFARSGGRFVGIAALKRPKMTYWKRIAEQSGFALDLDHFPFELGYVFVQNEARGSVATPAIGA